MKSKKKFWVTVMICSGVLLSLSPMTIHHASAADESSESSFFTSFESSESTQVKQNEINDQLGVHGITDTFGSVVDGDLSTEVNISSIQGSDDFNPDTETKKNLFDGNVKTKFNTNSDKNVWVSFSLDKAEKIGEYAIASANDVPGRDPKDWELLGSNDGKTWTSLDKEADQKFSGRQTYNTYKITTNKAYNQFKLVVSKNNGEPMTQFSELVLGTGVKDTQKNAMATILSDGPTDAINQISDKGWTGDKAFEVKGKVTDSGKVYAHNDIVDNLNVRVNKDTSLQYKIYPSDGEHNYDNHYDYSYTPMHMTVDLEFSDGTHLSDLKPTSTDGFEVTPEAQGDSRSLYYNQWNQITTNIGEVATGKTITKIMVSFEDNNATAGKTFDNFLDDVKIFNGNSTSSSINSTVDYVNTLRGTNSNGNFSRGLTVPATTVPNGFNFWAPVTEYGNDTMYQYQQNGGRKFQHITISHEPSIWVGDRGTWQFMVNTSIDANKVQSAGDIDHSKYETEFTHDNEVAKPQLYSVKFDKGAAAGSSINLTPSMHGSITELAFDESAKNKNVIFDSSRADGTLTFNKDTNSFTEITKNGNNGMKQMYVYGTFDKPYIEAKVENNKQGIVSFNDNKVTMKIATSFISAAQAKKNYDLELAQTTFTNLQKQTTDEWNTVLNKIQVKGATDAQKTTLYSNLYRLYMYPTFYGENKGTNTHPQWIHSDPYSGDMEHPVAKDGVMYYNNGFWDTYRTAWSAYSLLSPDKESEYLNGLTQHYKDSTWIPRWIAPGGTNSMVGTNQDIIFADALNKGIKFNSDDAYQAALKDATVKSTNLVNGGRAGLNQSEFIGYVPSEVDNYGLSWSIEGYISDFGLYQMAMKKGDKAEAAYFKNRALSYVTLFDNSSKATTDKWFKGKKTDGSWTTTPTTFDPTNWARDYTETNAYDYGAVPVPQDGNGLANLYGGAEGLADKLDQIVTTPGEYSSSGYVIHEMREQREGKLGMYAHSNQPGHDILYMYAFSSRPYETQKYVRDILNRLYVGSDFGQGYLGDEDNGEASAWYILSALGLYPENLATNQFELGSPLFQEAKVQLPNGKTLTIKAPNNSQKNVYVDSVTFNDKKVSALYMNYEDLMKGGTLTFDMSSTPNKTRGTNSEDKPASLTQGTNTAYVKTDAFDSAKKIDSTVDDSQNLTDNNSDTSATIKNGSSIDITLDKARIVSMLTLTNINKDTTFKSVSVLGSNDGQKWTEVGKQNDVGFKYDQQTKPYLVDQGNKAFSHYRILFNGGEGKIGEIELLGNMKDTAGTVSLDGADIQTIKRGKSLKLNTTLAGVSENDLSWSVQKDSVVSVANDGTVTAKASGMSYVYVTTPGGIMDKVLIRVTN